MTMEAWTYCILFVIGVALFFCYFKTGHLIKCIAFSAFTGLPALATVWVLAKFTALSLSFTPFTVFVSGILGIPGVVSMLLLNLI